MEVSLIITLAKALNDGNCFDLQQFVETRLKTKYNLSSTTIFFEVINLNEDFSIDLEENDIKKVFSLDILSQQVDIVIVFKRSIIFDEERRIF